MIIINGRASGIRETEHPVPCCFSYSSDTSACRKLGATLALSPIDEQTGRVDQTRLVPCGRPCAGTVFAGLGTASSAEHTVSVDMSPAGPTLSEEVVRAA